MDWTQNRLTVCGLNPNDFGALLVMILLSLVPLLRCRHWSISIPVLLTQGILLFLIIGTASRGAVVALTAALSLGFTLEIRRIGMTRRALILSLVALILALAALSSGLIVFQKGERLGTLDLAQEASAGRRLQVWATLPAMLASAPGGWGYGQAGPAYNQWFQSMENPVTLKHLLSSHFSWLVEFPWLIRWAYLTGWALLFFFLFSSRLPILGFWPGALWCAFALALLFNDSGKWWNWILPLAWLLGVLVLRLTSRHGLPSRFIFGILVCSLLVIGLPSAFRSWLQPAEGLIQAQDNGNRIRVGAGQPDLVILGPDLRVLGEFYAHSIRRQVKESDAQAGAINNILVIRSPIQSGSYKVSGRPILLMAGKNETDLVAWLSCLPESGNGTLILMNCRVSPGPWIQRFSGVQYLRGQFYGDPYDGLWQQQSVHDSAVSYKIISGKERYVPGWLELLSQLYRPNLDRLDQIHLSK
jgi:hypothetical protein